MRATLYKCDRCGCDITSANSRQLYFDKKDNLSEISVNLAPVDLCSECYEDFMNNYLKARKEPFMVKRKVANENT